MSPTIRLCCLLALLATQALRAETIESASGNFRVESPEGWTVDRTMPLKEAIFLHPEVRDGFRCNMVFIEESLREGVSLEKAVELSLPLLQRMAPDCEIISRAILSTQSGEKMIKVAYKATIIKGKPPMHNIAYLTFVGGRRLLTITVSGVAATPQRALAEAEESALSVKAL